MLIAYLPVSRRVGAAHLQALTAQVAVLGGQAVQGRPVGHRPGVIDGPAVRHSPASIRPPVPVKREA